MFLNVFWKGASWLSLRVSLSITWLFLNSRSPYPFIRWWFCVVVCVSFYFSSLFFRFILFQDLVRDEIGYPLKLCGKKLLTSIMIFLLVTEMADSKLQLCRHSESFQKLLFCIFDWISDQRLYKNNNNKTVLLLMNFSSHLPNAAL